MKETRGLDATCIILHLEEKSTGKKVNATIDLSINLVIVFYIVWLEMVMYTFTLIRLVFLYI